MKESILDVLLYLFEHYFTEDVPPPGELGFLDRDRLANGPLLDELTGAGFSSAEIHKAFDWLGALAEALRGRLGEARADAAEDLPGTVPAPTAPADPDYQRLWQALGHDPTGMDTLVSRTGLTTARLSSMLLLMELEGRVVSGHGRYMRKAS